MENQQVFVLTQKVFINCNGYDTMSASNSCVIGVFADHNSAVDFAQNIIAGITDCNGQQRTFHYTDAKDGRPANFHFAFLQRETALYPRFVYECVKETVLSKEN